MSRGNAKQRIVNRSSDRQLFLDVLENVVERYRWLCHAYCLMSNHYHLLIETLEANLSRGMRQLNGVYTRPEDVIVPLWLHRSEKFHRVTRPQMPLFVVTDLLCRHIARIWKGFET
jgi:hypothetical protein